LAAPVITSIIGTFFVRLGRSQSIMGALYKGFIASAVLSLVAIWFVTDRLIGMGPLTGATFTGKALYICAIVGLVVTGLIIWITEFYTGTTSAR
jgi:K(+)-stimulated pyrophosphate-energized sodium pump